MVLSFQQEPSSWFVASTFSLCPEVVEGLRKVWEGVCCKNTKPIQEDCILVTQAPPKAPPLTTITSGERTSTREFGKTQAFRP